MSGRTYPVEVRYRPVEDRRPRPGGRDRRRVRRAAARRAGRRARVPQRRARDPRHGGRAAGAGSTSRCCRCTRGCRRAEQQRVFKPHAKRRVVLATNVAETSLTVPGIRYVVDPGTARISRYSARLKVQRLPIEPISQASADQRKGRCGRTSDGICIRLYAEEDFARAPALHRPRDPAHEPRVGDPADGGDRAGRVEDFPFLDPPDKRQIRDGIRLLEELGALDASGRLTKVGRRLAELPVDPRMARMVVEADKLGCAEEVIVIAAALSIQDPRERPSDKTGAGRPAARPVRRPGLGLRLVPEPVALPARAPAAALEQPVPQALPGRAPAPPADARVAGPRGAAARGGQGRRGALQPHAGRAAGHPPRAARPACLSHVGMKDERGARVHRRARRAVRDLPRLGAVQEAAELGDGGRAGGDDAAVGPGGGADRSGRRGAAGRAPGQAHLQRAALGSAPAGRWWRPSG